MSQDGNGRHPYELGLKPWIWPAQSLALRFLFMFVGRTSETFAAFITRIMGIEEEEHKAALLVELEAPDVFRAVRAWLQVSQPQHQQSRHVRFAHCMQTGSNMRCDCPSGD